MHTLHSARVVVHILWNIVQPVTFPRVKKKNFTRTRSRTEIYMGRLYIFYVNY